MSEKRHGREAIERSIRRCYSTWSERYYSDYYQGIGAYPPVHTDIVRRLLEDAGARSVLDAGCGPASMLRDLDIPDLDRYGFDLTPEMVDEARRVLHEQGVSANHIWEGSVLDAAAFQHTSGRPGGFDAAICFGVLPHVPAESDHVVLCNLRDAVRPGGLIAIEARNALFALFTLNRYSREFFRERLIEEDRLLSRAGEQADPLRAALAELDARFRMDLPPLRTGYEDEPGYDEVLSRTHVPMALQSAVQEVGLIDIRIKFYHFHSLPPMLEARVPELFRRESLAMENPDDWRGHVMASAFILVARRPN